MSTSPSPRQRQHPTPYRRGIRNRAMFPDYFAGTCDTAAVVTEDDVRRLALGLPGAFERASYGGRPSWRTEPRMFAWIRDEPEDIRIPAHCGYDANENPAPSGTEPFEVYRDELVTVTATLVAHPPLAPAFAFRFDTARGAVTISGDTAPCDNLVRLARDTDLLLHEAIDVDWVERAYQDEDPHTARATIDHHRKAHTSPTQAGDVATRAGARVLALHHLVPGNAEPSVWRAAESTFAGPVLTPNDLDHVSFAHVEAWDVVTAEKA